MEVVIPGHFDGACDADALAAEQPCREGVAGRRLCDIAEAMGVAEVTLLTSGKNLTAVQLVPRWESLFCELRTLGRTRAVIENRHAWISRCMTMREVVAGTDAAGDARYLATHFAAWGSAFAVTRRGMPGRWRSLAVFDRAGASAVDFYVPEEYWPALDSLIAGFAADDQAPADLVPPVGAVGCPADRPNDDIDVAGLRAAWDALRPGASFDALLRESGVGRAQAYRLAGRGRAEVVDPRSLMSTLTHAAACARPVVLRIFSAGASCAYAGTIRTVEGSSGWLTLRAPCMTAAVNIHGIAAAWAVERPGFLEPSITLEYFDADDRRLLSLALPASQHVDYL